MALAAMALPLALTAGTAAAQEAQEAPERPVRWSAHGTATTKAGTERQIGEFDVFIPLWQNDNSMLFGDLRAQTDHDTNLEGNLGLGYRWMAENWIFGGYGFFDYRRSDDTGNRFMQGTVGIEVLSEVLDLRANFYIPEPDAQVTQEGTVLELVGTSLQMRAGQERALPGTDGEVGYRLWGAENGRYEVRAFAGGYYFGADDFETVAGGRGRVEARLFDIGWLGAGSRLTFGAEVTHDTVRDTQAFAVARLTVPFGGGRRSGRGGLERRMTDYVVRDVDIVTATATSRKPEAVAFAATGATAGAVTVVDAAGDLVTAAASGGNGDLIVADGSAGAFNTTASIVLKEGQMLVGGGTELQLVGTDSGARATYTVPGARGTINASLATGTGVVTITGKTAVIGLDINETSANQDNSAITGNTIFGGLIADNTITMANARGNIGISLTGPVDVTITGNAITTGTDLFQLGISMRFGWGNTVSGNTISTVGESGIGIALGSTTTLVTGNSITTGGLNAAGIGLGAGADNNTITGNSVTTGGDTAHGLSLSDVSGNRLAGNTITTNGLSAEGVRLNRSNSNSVDGNNIVTTGSGLGGIHVILSASNRLDNNVIVTTLANGIFLEGSLTDLNTGVGNSYSGPGLGCLVLFDVTGSNPIDLCP